MKEEKKVVSCWNSILERIVSTWTGRFVAIATAIAIETAVVVVLVLQANGQNHQQDSSCWKEGERNRL